MARKNRRSASSNDDAIDQMLSLPSPPVTTALYTPVTTQIIQELDDSRLWSPEPPIANPARDMLGRPARILERPTRTKLRYAQPQRLSKARMAYSRPEQVTTCVRRKNRREVLFALKLHGKGAGGRRHRTNRSNIKC